MRSVFLIATLGLLVGCPGGDGNIKDTTPPDPSDTDTDTDADTDADTDTDTDADTDTDTDTDTCASADTGCHTGILPPLPLGPDCQASGGFNCTTFCAAGGKISGSGYSGTTCFAPLDITSGTVSGSGYIWQAGPIFMLDPE